MSTNHDREVFATQFRLIGHPDMARIVREAELMRGEYIARLFRSLSRSIASGARSLAALLTPAGASRGVVRKP